MVPVSCSSCWPVLMEYRLSPPTWEVISTHQSKSLFVLSLYLEPEVHPERCYLTSALNSLLLTHKQSDSPAVTFPTLFSQRSLSSSISCTTSHICTDKTCGKGRRQSIKALKPPKRRSSGEVQDGGYRTSLPFPQLWPFCLNGKTSRTVPNRPPSSG